MLMMKRCIVSISEINQGSQLVVSSPQEKNQNQFRKYELNHDNSSKRYIRKSQKKSARKLKANILGSS